MVTRVTSSMFAAAEGALYWNREFWCKGYYVDTVGKNTKAIKQYIADQLKRDKESDQLAMFDPRDPFMGSK